MLAALPEERRAAVVLAVMKEQFPRWAIRTALALLDDVPDPRLAEAVIALAADVDNWPRRDILAELGKAAARLPRLQREGGDRHARSPLCGRGPSAGGALALGSKVAPRTTEVALEGDEVRAREGEVGGRGTSVEQGGESADQGSTRSLRSDPRRVSR